MLFCAGGPFCAGRGSAWCRPRSVWGDLASVWGGKGTSWRGWADSRLSDVISDQFGGCELHELYNGAYKLLAFLHVYRGGGRLVKYKMAQGWVLRSVKRSSTISRAYGMVGSNWAFACVNRRVSPPTVQSEFIHVPGSLPLTVQAVDDRNAPNI